MVMAVSYLSDFHFHAKRKKYIPKDPLPDPSAVIVPSDFIPLKNKIKEIQLEAKFKTAVPDSGGLICCLGIEFYKEEEGQLYLLKARNCMKIAHLL
jgi:hypothetical protein